MANRRERKKSEKPDKPKNENHRSGAAAKKKKMQMKDLVLIYICVAAVFIGAWCGMSGYNESKEYRDQAATLEEENDQLNREVESLTGELAVMKASYVEESRTGSENLEDIPDPEKQVHIRNRNLVYPESYSITLDGFEEIDINVDELKRELGDFGYEYGIEIDSAIYERKIFMNIPGTTAFIVSINGNNDELISCICYEDGGMAMMYDGSMQTAEDGNNVTPSPSPTARPTITPTATPTTAAPQSHQGSSQTAQIEHIYDPEMLSINDVPNGLYEAFLDINEMRDALYRYIYANHIYDDEASIDEDYEVTGPYYDFKVIMKTDSRDVYMRYDSDQNKYYCGFNSF